MKVKNYYIVIVSAAIALSIFAWLLTNIFETEKPVIKIKALPEFISSPKRIFIVVSDKKMGLREIRTELIPGKKKVLFFKKTFSTQGLLNKKGIHDFRKGVVLDPIKLGFSDGELILQVYARDCSKRNKFRGNIAVFKKKVIIDTLPPSIMPKSRLNYFSIGGSGLIVYEASKDTVKSGIYLNHIFFSGYPLDAHSRMGRYYACYIGIPCDLKSSVDLFIWAKDRAGNISVARFYYRIKPKRFRKRNIIITDRFLKRVLPFFSYCKLNPKDPLVKRFLKINRKLREKNSRFIKGLLTNTSKKRLWKGAWVSLKNAKCTARFADHRFYFYKKRLIDQQLHMGLDLASIANAPVPASNSGRVIYAGRLGIYGLSVIIDHGQGIFSIYGHMSRIDVEKGQDIKKGETIGVTGQTGLAGGDHLHFSIMVNGIFVNPEEWLDYHWLRNNIIRKLRVVGGY